MPYLADFHVLEIKIILKLDHILYNRGTLLFSLLFPFQMSALLLLNSSYPPPTTIDYGPCPFAVTMLKIKPP